MATAKVDIRLNQGEDRVFTFVLSDDVSALDLTGYKASMQIRQNFYSKPLATLTSDNGQLVVDGSTGKVRLFLSHTVTEELPAATLLYDIELTSSSGYITRIIEGKIYVSAEVTRIATQSVPSSGSGSSVGASSTDDPTPKVITIQVAGIQGALGTWKDLSATEKAEMITSLKAAVGTEFEEAKEAAQDAAYNAGLDAISAQAAATQANTAKAAVEDALASQTSLMVAPPIASLQTARIVVTPTIAQLTEVQ